MGTAPRDVWATWPLPGLSIVRREFLCTVTGKPGAVRSVRKIFQRWLTEHDWPPAASDDLVLAVSEAITNAVEHGYGDAHLPPGKVTVRAKAIPGPEGVDCRMLVTVTDHGVWRPVPLETDNRRLGIPLMRAVLEGLDVNGTGLGTRVTMTSLPVPLAETSSQHQRDARG